MALFYARLVPFFLGFLSSCDGLEINLLNLNLNPSILDGLTKLTQSSIPSPTTPTAFDNVDPSLLQQFSLSPDATPELLLEFGGNQAAIREVESSRFETLQLQREALVTGLMSLASRRQSTIKTVLRILGVDFKSFWGGNQLIISKGSLDLVQLLAAIPDVTWIGETPKIKAGPIIQSDKGPEPPAPPAKDNGTLTPPQWNIAKTGAFDVMHRCDCNGTGIIVANIDTGVRITHEALIGNFIPGGFKNFIDPDNSKIMDDDGHGSHTMGTMCGQKKGIGMAPGARWIACRACDSQSCPTEALFNCGEWILEICIVFPTTLCPHIISNSWGGLPLIPSQTFYNGIVDAWTCFGLLHVFAFGNLGPLCFSGGPPGNQPRVFATGSTDIEDSLSYYSSKGPGFPCGLKPNVAAPGQNIFSAWNTSDTAYNTISGTSMSSPCVAGAMALVLCVACKKENCTFEQGRCMIPKDTNSFKHVFMNTIQALIESTADQKGLTVFLPTFKCKELSLFGEQTLWPNFQFGWGRINAFKAVSKIINCKKKS